MLCLSIVEVYHRVATVLFRIAAFPKQVASGITCLIKMLGYEFQKWRMKELGLLYARFGVSIYYLRKKRGKLTRSWER